MSIRIQVSSASTPTAEKYIMSDALRNAVEVAIALEQPLLLTGEPGTGKTRLAFKVAAELAKVSSNFHFADQPLIFNTKTTSTARDLFYTYDALAHFQAANINKAASGAATNDFIDLQAFGKAIALTNPTGLDTKRFRTDLGKKAQSSVVLIDEIDKAPRDFPNDILAEIERYEFQIKEQDNYAVRRDPQQRVVVIMTSNSEKNLPDAFLRRCVFYHIPFPDQDQLLAIAKTQLGEATKYTDQLLNELIEKFNTVRQTAVRKPPATAELIAWLRILEMRDIMHKKASEHPTYLRDHLSVLVKTKEDLDAVKDLF
ncbi:MAG: MoxR family ATPase [Bacteroidetes bacterium]|nr:MAG: MoxR family ATPase [Bacteroidota bacterium]PTM09153.1 MAG: MoxR family ATPase [Bacteroidota bacterium]